MKAGLVVAALIATFMIVSPASAAVVMQIGSTAGYLALPGETNDVVATMDGDAVLIADKGSSVFVVGPGCTSLSGRRARCAGAKTLHFDLGDGNDTLRADTPLHTVASGGDGNDVLVTGGAADELDGGAGNDILDGRAGGDQIDGGAGTDTVDYSSRTQRVIVTLDGAANDGEQAEGDDVVGTEIVIGGQGNDILVGDAGADALYGGPGNDSLAGAGGADTLVGGPGQDGINANDPVATADAVGCGAARDRVFGDAQDAIRADCETVDRSGTFGYRSTADAGADPPVLGKSVVVKPISGVVLLVPGDPNDPTAEQPVPAAPPVPLDGERNVPVGSVIDTRLGTVEMTTAIDFAGTTQTGQFHSGPFQIFQKAVEGATADLALRGGKSFTICGAQGGPGLPVFSSRTRGGGRGGRVIRRLWSDAHGKFRTGGRYGAATVRGTRWLTADLCGGTFVKVVRGTVVVHDAAQNRDVVVNAGEQYLARAP